MLVALGWSDHIDHERAAVWVATCRKGRKARLLTSAIPELGFVRVSVQRTAGRVSVAEASETLKGMLETLAGRMARCAT